ncbi:uncharacterized protein LOC124138076 [Haliotis rufescens]|uniref:uncharacterized protein LOC124138076 n=1 Tax=Haliotis rufescens TaxID=6454 RepID=UPI00201F39A9|nr:uncharacterized protein LOC124138076 [Haliotis rufescens]
MMEIWNFVLIGCLVSFSTAEFQLPTECNSWLQQCYQVSYQEALMTILFSPSSLTTKGSLVVDCSAETTAARQRCKETMPMPFCSFPLSFEATSQFRSFLCANSDVITSNAECWSDPRFLQTWTECTDRPRGTQYPGDCLEERLSTIPASVCSSSAVSVVSELPGIFISAFEDM